MALVVDLVEQIETMFLNIPDKRKKSEYKEWVSTVNKLILEVNTLANLKLYNTVK
jgi:hypothetical protein